MLYAVVAQKKITGRRTVNLSELLAAITNRGHRLRHANTRPFRHKKLSQDFVFKTANQHKSEGVTIVHFILDEGSHI